MKLQRTIQGRTTGLWFTSLAIFTIFLTGCASELEKRFQAHIDYLASDELGGRGVGAEGIEKAAEYIAGYYNQLGVEPAGDDGTYFQSFPLTIKRSLTDECRLRFSDDPAVRLVKRDFIPFHFSSNEKISGPLAFCGYGIVAEDQGRDDFVHIDVKGKVAIMFRSEPPSWSNDNGFPSRFASFRNKIYNAKDRGAVAVLIISQKTQDGTSDDLVKFQAKGSADYGIPAFHVSRAMATWALKRESDDTLDALQERLDAGAYASKDWSKTTVEAYPGFKKIQQLTRNVVGVVRGEGPLANEFVVIGAHYDHLGLAKPMMRKFKKGKLVADSTKPEIHNGADDNASGVAGLLEIAAMFTKAKPRPQRSILFVAFTAEESGLHGSKYFVDQSSNTVENTVAMLNMDMIGRMGRWSNQIQIFGAQSGDSFPVLLAYTAKKAGLILKPTSETGNRSDHAPFIRKEIPSMHFYTGGHSDYHKPTDDAHKINARGGAKVTTMVYDIAHHLAMKQQKPKYQVVKRKKKGQSSDSDNLPTYRVVMGLAPGYGDDGKEGMVVDAVSPDGPAEVAGMKSGDRIIQIGDKKVANVYDYMAATRNNKAGDTVEVIVTRKEKKITLKVTLAPAR